MTDNHTHADPHEHTHEDGTTHSHAPLHPISTLPGRPENRAAGEEYDERVSTRSEYRNVEDMALETEQDKFWVARIALTKSILAITEEQLSRIVIVNIPEAVEIVLYEDKSHDAPHGHVLHVVDKDGKILMEGTGDDWHDAGWTSEVDEYVWDIYNLDRQGFYTIENKRIRKIPLVIAN